MRIPVAKTRERLASGTVITGRVELAKVHPDGRTERWTVERNRTPASTQAYVTRTGVRVIPANRLLRDRKTGRIVKPSRIYWTFAQTFVGGPSAKGDLLGGFASGQHVQCYANQARHYYATLVEAGLRPRRVGVLPGA